MTINIGDRYSLWTTQSRTGRKWNCICDCGNLGIVTTWDLTRTDGKNSNGCRDCANKKKVKYLKDEGAARNTFYYYKKNARVRGYEFGLSFEEFLNLSRQNCFYCLALPKNKKEKTSKDAEDFVYNGIDRVRNDEGYTVKNCVPCCTQCNRGKMDYTVEDFYRWINKVNDRRDHVQAVLVEEFGFEQDGFDL